MDDVAGTVRYRVIETKRGPFVLMEDEAGELTATWGGARREEGRGAKKVEDRSMRSDLVRRLVRYFAGRGGEVDFADVPTPAGPPFFAACWEACRRIEHGQTWTYLQLAQRAAEKLGRKGGSARPAGQAMRHNPLPVIVPCHRVLASGGGIGGYAGHADEGSRALGTKMWLLRLEQQQLDRGSQCFATGDTRQ